MPTQAEVEKWLGHLWGTPKGRIHLVNMYLHLVRVCEDDGMEEELRSFLIDCVALGANSADEAYEHFGEVSRLMDKYGFLLAVETDLLDEPGDMSTTISSDSFHFRLVDEDFVKNEVVHYGLVFEPPERVREAETSYAESLREMTRTGAWIGPRSSLGFRSADGSIGYAWFSDRQALERELGSFAKDEVNASDLRDALGLIHHRKEPYLLLISIPASDLASVDNVKAGRPTFANLGNERFAAYLSDEEALLWYQKKWGLTVNLAKLCKQPGAVNGMPERVVSPLPLAELTTNPVVDPVGRVSGLRGITPGLDDDDTFAILLASGAAPGVMTQQLAALVGP